MCARQRGNQFNETICCKLLNHPLCLEMERVFSLSQFEGDLNMEFLHLPKENYHKQVYYHSCTDSGIDLISDILHSLFVCIISI